MNKFELIGNLSLIAFYLAEHNYDFHDLSHMQRFITITNAVAYEFTLIESDLDYAFVSAM